MSRSNYAYRILRHLGSDQSPHHINFESLTNVITPAVSDHLSSRGYAVVDGIFGTETTNLLRNEINSLRSVMHLNKTFLVAGEGQTLVEKHSIFEAELLEPKTRELAPLCAQMQHDTTLLTLLNVYNPTLALSSQAIKLQYNAGDGGCFPIHTDTEHGIDGRQVTAIWYLNEHWEPGNGGELRLYPFLEFPVTIEPINDRLVLFSSMYMPHRVLPSLTKRICFTIWLSGANTSGVSPKEHGEVRQALHSASNHPIDDATALKLLAHPSLRNHAMKWLHKDEWRQSLLQAHPPKASRDLMIEKFDNEVKIIEKALRPLLPALIHLYKSVLDV